LSDHESQGGLQFAAEGKVAIIETQPLEEINSVFDRLRRGDVQGRVVLKMAERAESGRSSS
jgi:propanol-preferring alcohol dehydrogenase